MQSKDNDDGWLTPVKEADEAMRKSHCFQLNVYIK